MSAAIPILLAAGVLGLLWSSRTKAIGDKAKVGDDVHVSQASIANLPKGQGYNAEGDIYTLPPQGALASIHVDTVTSHSVTGQLTAYVLLHRESEEPGVVRGGMIRFPEPFATFTLPRTNIVGIVRNGKIL